MLQGVLWDIFNLHGNTAILDSCQIPQQLLAQDSLQFQRDTHFFPLDGTIPLQSWEFGIWEYSETNCEGSNVSYDSKTSPL